MYVAVIFLPLIGALIAGFFGRLIGDRASQIVTCSLLVLSAIFSWVIFFQIGANGGEEPIKLLTWLDTGDFEANWALKFDSLTAVMLIVVNTVSAMVHIYAVGYMSHDPHKARFMAYLSLFTFAMLMLVTADNFVQMFFGWEGVGLASYLLIGFWYERPSANAAAMKAFIVNRVGDFGFALGIFATFILFDSVQFDAVFSAAAEQQGKTLGFLGYEIDAMTLICLLLFIGAMGKSAQLGLHTWLPDAMEGPTPVSALIHAATMVTAGVFMISRLSPMFEYAPLALDVVCIIGASTAFFAATVGLTQTDIKRVIAYSTCSQLGYMFFAIGVGAYSAAVFHLMTHAFFKALLFLCAGSVIHAMSDEQDMRKMGGIWKMIPVTYGLMWIGSLALAGVPPFAGFFSKDMILESAYAAHSSVGQYAFWLGVIAAFMTAFYSWRLLLMTFHGTPRADEKVMAHVHESPKVMLIPLVILAIGAVFAGWLGYGMFVGDGREQFWREAIHVVGDDVIEHAHHVPTWVKIIPLVMGVSGIALAYVMYMFVPGLPAKFAKLFKPLYLFSLNKWYFDELYDRLFVRPAMMFGRWFWKGGDTAIIDNCGPNALARGTAFLSKKTSFLQSGYVYHYAFAMFFGVIVLVTVYLFKVLA